MRGYPDLEAPDEFAAAVYYAEPHEGNDGENIEIIRIDDSHGEAHVDRFYRRDAGDKPPFDGGLWDAVEDLSENWRRYAESFKEVHGRPKKQP
jgi:hypothetical protein